MQFKGHSSHKSKYHTYKILLRLTKHIHIYVPLGSSLISHKIDKIGITTFFNK